MTGDDGADEVDWCPLNFTTEKAVEDLEENHLIPLDALNARLALVNLLHCRANGIPDASSGDRVDISDIILNAGGLSGAGSEVPSQENSSPD